MARYNNYHKHDHYGNPWTMDVVVKPEEYCKRAIELGHDTVFTTNHGVTGNIFDWLNLLSQKDKNGNKIYDLKLRYGMEAYFVKDRFSKDRSNRHLIIIAKNDNGAMQLNDIMTEAHSTGFYYKPRVDTDLLFSLNSNDFIVTTACVAGIWDDTELVLALHKKFGKNFFLEVQPHLFDKQVEVNQRLLKLSNEAHIPIIHANDSHYIYPEDTKYRNILLKAKGINYEDESKSILDYPDDEEIYCRYDKQGVLSRQQVREALDNTLIFDECEPFTLINDDIKLPSVTENPTEELRKIIRKQWLIERNNIPKDHWQRYTDAISYELDIVEKTHMENYFLIDYQVVKDGQEKYDGRLTNTGRGCFTGEALVHTLNCIKPLKDIEIGDEVLTIDGTFQKVINTINYTVDEDLVEIQHLYGSVKGKNPTCTKDHKIYIRRNGVNQWIEAKDIVKSDYVCVPKVKNAKKSFKVIIEDNDFFYFPIININVIPRQKTTVYDLSVANNHNYVINNMLVHNSAPSFYITKLLGLTDIDRVSSPITLFPSRFMSVERILKTRSLPDIDLNTTDREPFIKATEDLLGKDNCAWMLAWKPLQDSSAFRTYCKGIGKDINEYDNIAKNLELYENDCKWKKIISDSKRFVGVIESISESPCSMVLYYKPIRKELGLVRTSKDKFCCLLDGYNCDKYKYLKNDYLTVTVWAIIRDVCKLAEIPIPTIKEINNLFDDATFDIYKKGLTSTINQADSDFATGLVTTYCPKNVSEMSAFVAIIRPGCASLLQDFIDRKPYTTGISELDEILIEGNHRMIYQELIMKYLIWLGIPEAGSYDIIKKIAKKKFKEEELAELKTKLLNGWRIRVGTEEGFIETWTVVEQAARYSFNASHSLSYAYDSLYGAYLKSHYPLEYYTVALNYYDDDSVRTLNLTNELSYFNIKLKPIQFRHSKGSYTLSKEDSCIYKGIKSIKYMNSKIADELYELKDNKYDSFVELLYDIQTKTSVNARQLKILIELDFFAEFGEANTLIAQYDFFDTFGTRKEIKKDELKKFNVSTDMVKKYVGKETAKMLKDIDINSIIKIIAKEIKPPKRKLSEIVKSQIEHLGYVDIANPEYSGMAVVLEVDAKYSPKIKFHSLKNGTTVECKVEKKTFNRNKLSVGNIVRIISTKTKPKSKKNEKGEWVYIPDTKDIWINSYKKIENI